MLDGDDARIEAAPVVDRFTSASVETFVPSRSALLSEAWARALELYPSKDMRGNIDAIAKLATADFADIPVETISEAAKRRSSSGCRVVPESMKARGKNRFCQDAPTQPEKYNRTKHDEVAETDAEDADIVEEIRAGENGADTTAEAAPRRRCIASNCPGRGAWHATSIARVPNPRPAPPS